MGHTMSNSRGRSCDGGVMPRACAEAFGEIRQTLGEIRMLTEATHEQAAGTNGRVAELFRLVGGQAVGAAEVRMELKQVRDKQRQQDTLARKLLTAGWRLALMLAGTVASLLGVRQLLE